MRLSAQEAVALFGGAFVLFVALGMVLPANAYSLAALQIICFALPAVLVMRARRVSLREGLGLKMPRPAAIAGAVMIGASFWYVSLSVTIAVLGDRATDPQRLAELRRSMSWADASLALMIVSVVIVPSVCEELLLRGVVARSLRPALGMVGAIALSAVLFAALHLPPVRMLPAGLFGLVLGFAAVTTDSVVPAILMHLLNNLISVVVLPGIASFEAVVVAHPIATGVVSIALTACGGAMLWRSRVSAPQ